MRAAMLILVAMTALLLVQMAAEAASGEFVPLMYTKSPTSRLLKRSLCNTFGGCGTKRSLDSSRYSSFSLGDEASEERRYDADTKMISEILEDIIDHLKKDQNYQQGKYVMLVPKRTKGESAATLRSGPLDDGNRQNIHGDGFGGMQIESE